MTQTATHWVREHRISLALAALLAVAALLWRHELVAWFGGGDGGGSSSAAVTARAGALSLDVRAQPDPPRAGENALLVELTGLDGAPITGATVEVSVWMPAMGSMPEMRTTPKVIDEGGGRYRAAFELAMRGTWTVDLSAQADAGRIEAQYTLTVGTPGLIAVGTAGGEGSHAAAMPSHAFAEPARAELRRALAAYEAARSALAADSLAGLGDAARQIAGALRAAAGAAPDAPEGLRAHVTDGADAAVRLAEQTELAGARTAFGELSAHVIAVAGADPALREGMHVFECGMWKGDNRWLQPGEAKSNPFMGPEMPTCGTELPLVRAEGGGHTHEGAPDGDEIDHYTCPMDSWVAQKQPGRCPVCGMDLVAVTKEEMRTGVLRIDHRRRQLIGLRTGLVEPRELTVTVRAIGRVAYDETRLSDVTLKVDGWIEKLHVNSTGQRVRKGQPLLDLYSPELYSAQQDYLLALSQRAAAQTQQARDRADALVRGARRRLALWDISDAQIDRIADRGEPLEHVPIVAPSAGFVVDKNVVEGAAVKRGERLFRIAALDRVWVEADVYEQDIPHVRVGDPAEVTLSHLPGRAFAGTIAFVYPFLDGMTRTARVRIELPNRDLELKPDMYANVRVTRALGPRLTVPEEAVIYSGPRRIVFLDVDTEKLRPQVIEVGAASDGFFEVLSGLEQGDRVVTSGNFLLSAESRLKSATGLW